MTITSSELSFQPSVGTVVFGVVILILTAVFSYLGWKRSAFSPGIGWLELLRIVIVALVAVTINQPEWREVFEPTEKPVLAVLSDQSGSMATADVLPEGESVGTPLTRAAVTQSLVGAEDWGELEGDLKLVFEDFSSEEDPVESATDLNGALDRTIEEHPNLRGVVLISDGDWNIGNSPARAATRLRMRDTPVFTLPVGSENRLPDIEISSFDVPTFAIVGKPVRLPYSISSALPGNHSTLLSIETGSGEKMEKEITIPAMGKLQGNFAWTPRQTGDEILKISLPVEESEKDQSNNLLTTPISIRKESLKVLILESFPRWEYRYLRNALERDPGVEVNCVLYHPSVPAMGAGQGYLDDFPGPEELSRFDVVFLGDVGLSPGQLTEAESQALRDHVANQAAGLVFLPGFRGNQHSLLDTALADLLPVVLDEAQPRGWGSTTPGQFELTDLGRRSLLTRLGDSEDANSEIWASLPGFQWFAGVSRAKAGTEVLATHSSETNRYGRIPLIITKTFGTGKILFMGTDGAWRWRKGVEDRYHYRFWGQVARWMAYQRNMSSGDQMRLFYSPDRPQTGDVLTLNANVMSVGGEPLRSATVIVQATAPSGAVKSVRLRPGGEGQWGLFTGNFTPGEPGEYRISMTCAENGGTLESGIVVQGMTRERTGQPARFDVMKEIAQISRGAVIENLRMDSIIEKISELPDPEPIERRLRIWSHPGWVGLLILLLALFWIGRKGVGAI